MWRQVVLPVIVVGVSWLTMSIVTTCYVLWLDASYQQVFDENIASATAAGLIEDEVWHLHAELLAEADSSRNWSSRLAEFQSAVRERLTELAASATTVEEKNLLNDMRELTTEYRQKVQAVLQPGGGAAAADIASQHAAL